MQGGGVGKSAHLIELPEPSRYTIVSRNGGGEAGEVRRYTAGPLACALAMDVFMYIR